MEDRYIYAEEVYSDGYNVEVTADVCPDNPRSFGTVGKFISTRNRDVLPREIDIDFRGVAEKDIEKLIKKKTNAVIILPISFLDHGAVRIWIGYPTDKWDSGRAGYYVATEEAIRDNYNEINEDTIEKARSHMEDEIETYNQYIRGEVYSMTLLDPLGNKVESMDGFYGDPEEDIICQAGDFWGRHEFDRYKDGDFVCEDEVGKMYARVDDDGNVSLEYKRIVHLGKLNNERLQMAADEEE